MHVRDEGSLFDAPIDLVWEYLLHDDESHSQAHRMTVRNVQVETLSENTYLVSTEQLIHGAWKKDVTRLTLIPPLCQVLESIEGHQTGLKMVFVYTPRGKKTQIDVYAEVPQGTRPAGQVKRELIDSLERAFAEDGSALRAIAKKRGPAS